MASNGGQMAVAQSVGKEPGEPFLSETRLAELTAEIVSAFVVKNPVPPADLPHLIKSVSASFDREPVPAEKEETITPAVPIRRSVSPEAITCLVCGKRCKTLKKHLSSAHGHTVESYREMFRLPDDYPLTAPKYSEARSLMAKQLGLGRLPGIKRGRQRKSRARS